VGIIYFDQITQLLDAAQGDSELFEAIVNAPFHNKIRATRLDLGIIVLLLVDKQQKTINRIALSDTEQAAGALKMSEKPFKAIKIPLGHPDNLIAKAIASGEPQCVVDWKYLFAPALNARAARFNQAGSGIEVSCVYPLPARDGGALIFSFFQDNKNIKQIHNHFMGAYSRLVTDYLQKSGQ
jgi:hypothetical protein